MNELMPIQSLSPADKAIYLAAKDTPVKYMESWRLGKELKNALGWIAKDIGLRNFTEEDMKYLVVRLTEIIKRHFSYFTMKDFRLAFEMAFVGGLDEFLPKNRDGQPNREHYQNLNAEYVCRILNAYKVKKLAVIVKTKPKEKEKPLEFSEEKTRELENRAKNKFKAAYLRFLETGNIDITPVQEILFYNILSEQKLVKPVEVSEKEQKEILSRMLCEMVMQGASRGDIIRKEQRGIQDEDVQYRAFVSARRREIEAAFKRMKDGNFNLETI